MAAGGLTPKQEAFVREYLVDLNATQAAIRAGYAAKNADVVGPRLLGNVGVAASIQAAFAERVERLQVDQDDVVRALMAIAFADVRDVTEWGREPGEDGDEPFFRMKPSAQLSDEVAAALQEVRLDASGRLVVKLSDKIRALELLGRHLGMFKKDVDVNVNVGITVGRLHELASGSGDGAGD